MPKELTVDGRQKNQSFLMDGEQHCGAAVLHYGVKNTVKFLLLQLPAGAYKERAPCIISPVGDMGIMFVVGVPSRKISAVTDPGGGDIYETPPCIISAVADPVIPRCADWART